MPRGRVKGVTSDSVLDRRMRVLALRREGYTLAAIAEALEITMGKASSDVKWLRNEGYDLGERSTGRDLPPINANMGILRAVATADDEAVVRREVNDRRIKGEPILSISIAMGISAHEVRRHIHDAARIAAEGDIETRRELELARLDRLLENLAEGIADGSPKSINAAVRVIAERCRIQGLYRPLQVEHTVITVDMIDAEMARLNEQLANLRSGVVDSTAVEVPALPA